MSLLEQHLQKLHVKPSGPSTPSFCVSLDFMPFQEILSRALAAVSLLSLYCLIIKKVGFIVWGFFLFLFFFKKNPLCY